MSQKISAKNLQYDTTLPPFLARLRGQAASSDGPDPLLVRNRRHAKPRSGSAGAEDAPLVVDDDGNVVQGMRVGADGAVTETEAKTVEEGTGPDKEDEKESLKEREAERVAGIGAGKKRKAGKVVGADEGDETVDKKTAAEKDDGQEVKSAVAAKKKKKAKKIKLSFGDDEG